MNVVESRFFVWLSYNLAAASGIVVMAWVYAVPLYQVSEKVVYGFVVVTVTAVVNAVVFTYVDCHGFGVVVVFCVFSTYLFNCAIVSVVL